MKFRELDITYDTALPIGWVVGYAVPKLKAAGITEPWLGHIVWGYPEGSLLGGPVSRSEFGDRIMEVFNAE